LGGRSAEACGAGNLARGRPFLGGLPLAVTKVRDKPARNGRLRARLPAPRRGLALLIVVVGLIGCKQAEQPVSKQPPPSTAPPEYFHPDPATAGTLSGSIEFKGPKEKAVVISMEADANCQKLHGGKPVPEEVILTGKGGGLANAFVYISAGLEGKMFEPSKDPVAVDQRGCLFAPRIIGLQTGQPLDLKNSDPVGHNIHPITKNNREWNEEEAPGAPDVQHKFGRAEVMIPLRCNIHGWMHAYLGVVAHPYFTVTAADGSFHWKNVPPGDYTITVWHEKLGEKMQQVHLAASGAAEVHFTYP
jgi:hypothetical protein